MSDCQLCLKAGLPVLQSQWGQLAQQGHTWCRDGAYDACNVQDPRSDHHSHQLSLYILLHRESGHGAS